MCNPSHILMRLSACSEVATAGIGITEITEITVHPDHVYGDPRRLVGDKEFSDSDSFSCLAVATGG